MAALWSGRPGWLGKLGLVLLTAWLVVLIVSVSHVYRTSPSSSYSSNSNYEENAQRLARMANDFEILKKQNEALRNIIIGYVQEKHEIILSFFPFQLADRA